jgi:hypothetical protein
MMTQLWNIFTLKTITLKLEKYHHMHFHAYDHIQVLFLDHKTLSNSKFSFATYKSYLCILVAFVISKRHNPHIILIIMLVNLIFQSTEE